LNPGKAPPLGKGEFIDGRGEELWLRSTSGEELLLGKGELVDESGGKL
jgi:hypothetical protein